MGEILINGCPGGSLPVTDRGLLYGDGVFETVAFYDGSSPLWSLHMDRLRSGCEVLGLRVPEAGLLLEESRAVLAGRGREAVRLILTRGSGGRAYFPPDAPEPTRIVMRRGFPQDLETQWHDGIDAVTSPVVLEATPALAGVKHLNRLPQVLIARHCRGQLAHEAVVVDHRDRLVEALTGNLVIARSGRLLVPAPHDAAVAGVGLAWLKARAGSELELAQLRRGEIDPGDEIWVINSVAGIRPICRLDGVNHPIGPACRTWQARWRELFGISG